MKILKFIYKKKLEILTVSLTLALIISFVIPMFISIAREMWKVALM